MSDDGRLSDSESAPSEASNSWQPIDTAPTDGTAVLVYVPEEPCGDVDIEAYMAVSSWDGYAWECGWDFAAAPTHWRPLPSPPTGDR